MEPATPRRREGLTLVIALGIVTVAGIALAGPAQWSMPEWALARQDPAPPSVLGATAEPVMPQPELEPEIPEPDFQLPLTMILVTIAVLLLGIAAYFLWRRLSGRRRGADRAARLDVSADVVVPADPDVAPAVRRGIERALDILDEGAGNRGARGRAGVRRVAAASLGRRRRRTGGGVRGGRRGAAGRRPEPGHAGALRIRG